MPKNIAKVPNQPAIAVEGLATRYSAGHFIEPHLHDAHQIVHAVAGVTRVLADNGTWILPPGRGLWVPTRTPHEIRCISQVEMRTVYLQGDHPSFPGHVQVTGISPLMREIMVRIAEGAGPRQLPHLAALLIDEIAASDIEPLCLPNPSDARIALLASRLREDPADRTSLDDWAERLGLSRRTLIRRVRDETGMSFREFRRQVRIIAGLERLALGEPVTTVALDVGFDSASAFIYAFRTVTGRTPGRYMT